MLKNNRVPLWAFILLGSGIEVGFLVNVHAEMNYLQLKGVHGVLRPEYSYLSPVHGFTVLKTGTLANLRFFGSYGGKNSAFDCKEPYFTQNDCPQDASSYFLQRLFPSPDGINLVANQVPSDLLSKLGPSTIGKILSRLSKLNPNDVIRLEDKTRFVEDLVELSYEDLKPDDFEQSTSKVAKKIPSYRKVKLELDGYKKNLETCKDSDQQQELIQLVEGLRGALDDLQPKVALSRRAELKKRKSWKELASFFSSLVESWQENQRQNSIYPKHFVEHSLLAYLWSKQSDKKDLLALFKNMPHVVKNEKKNLIQLGGITDQQNQWLEESYTFQDYTTWKEGFQNKKPTSAQVQELDQNPELSGYLAYSYQMVDRSISPIFSYAQSAHKSLGKASNSRKYGLYSDCGESSLRNFFNVVIYDKHKNSFNPELLKSIADRYHLNLYSQPNKKNISNEKGLIGFYTRNRTLDSMVNDRVRDDWSRRVVSGLSQVKYLKPAEAPVCEIDSGITNMLSVMESLIGDRQEEKSLGALTKNENKEDSMTIASHKWDRICELFSREGFKLDWEVSGTQNKKIPRDTGVELTFLVNGTPSFSWGFQGGHFVVKDLTQNKLDWRVQVGKDLVQKVEHLSSDARSTLPWYTHADNFDFLEKELLKTEDKQLGQHLFFSLPLQSNDLKLLTLERVFEDFSKDPALRKVVNRLISKLPGDDTYAQTRVLNAALKNHVPYAQEIQDQYLEKFHSTGSKEAAVLESVNKGYLEVLKVLEEKGADLSKKDGNGNTPLHSAATSGKLEIAKFLVEIQPQTITDKNKKGNTPLHEAILMNKKEVSEFLAETQPQTIIEINSFGDTPLKLAVASKQWDLAQLLAEKNPRAISKKDRSGQTPLYRAATAEQWQLVQFLAEKNPKAISVKDNYGNDVLWRAEASGEDDLVNYLKKLKAKS